MVACGLVSCKTRYLLASKRKKKEKTSLLREGEGRRGKRRRL